MRVTEGGRQMIEISGELKGELDIKSFYLEGLEIRCTCPKCEVHFEYDPYLSYPSMNEQTELDMCCPDCDHEWSEKIVLSVSIEIQKEGQ